MTRPGEGIEVTVPAQDITWNCHTCAYHVAFTILWYSLTEDVGIICPHCKHDPVWVHPPQIEGPPP